MSLYFGDLHLLQWLGIIHVLRKHISTLSRNKIMHNIQNECCRIQAGQWGRRPQAHRAKLDSDNFGHGAGDLTWSNRALKVFHYALYRWPRNCYHPRKSKREKSEKNASDVLETMICWAGLLLWSCVGWTYWRIGPPPGPINPLRLMLSVPIPFIPDRLCSPGVITETHVKHLIQIFRPT